MSRNPNVPDSPAVAADVVIFTVREGALSVLLVERAWEPFTGDWALPGGFVKPGERSVDAATRILEEKAGVRDVFVEQLYTFDEPSRDPRGPVVSITYYALVPWDSALVRETDATWAPKFFPAEALPKLAFDHRDIVRYAGERLRAKLGYANIAYSLLPREFTMTELRATYEAILGRPLDKRNFQKKYLDLGLLKATGKTRQQGRQRPARLYTFKSRKPIELARAF
jgi:8-oxo-dGTP diphosphatase